MPSTLKDIAKTAGVSVPTVSDILNRNRANLYNAKTCDHVRAVSRRLDYRPHRSAQAMRSNRTRVIGFATVNLAGTGQLANYNIYPFLVGLNKRLAEDAYHVALVELTELEGAARHTLPESLRERFFDALVVHYGLSNQATATAMTGKIGLPVVWWDSGIFASHGCVYRDEAAVTNQLMNRLLAMGHRRIAYMAGETGWSTYQAGGPLHYSYAQRLETYQARLKAQGLSPCLVVGYDVEGVARQLTAHQATAVLIQGAWSEPLFEAFALLGWQAGRDIAVATLDRETRLPQHGLAIGGMLYDRYEAGRLAGEMVLSQLETGQLLPSVRSEGKFEMGDTIVRPSLNQAAP